LWDSVVNAAMASCSMASKVLTTKPSARRYFLPRSTTRGYTGLVRSWTGSTRSAPRSGTQPGSRTGSGRSRNSQAVASSSWGM